MELYWIHGLFSRTEFSLVTFFFGDRSTLVTLADWESYDQRRPQDSRSDPVRTSGRFALLASYLLTFDLVEFVLRSVAAVMQASSHTKWSVAEEPTLNIVSKLSVCISLYRQDSLMKMINNVVSLRRVLPPPPRDNRLNIIKFIYYKICLL